MTKRAIRWTKYKTTRKKLWTRLNKWTEATTKKKRVSDSETFIYSVDLFFFSLGVVVVLRAYASIFSYCRETKKKSISLQRLKCPWIVEREREKDRKIDRVKPIEIPTARKMKRPLVHCKNVIFLSRAHHNRTNGK